MNNDTKLKQIHHMDKISMCEVIRENIKVPATDYVEIGDDFLRLSYEAFGYPLHLLLSTKEEAAYFLKSFFSDLADYELHDEEMYFCIGTLEVYSGPDGEPIQKEGFIWISWKEFRESQHNHLFPLQLDRRICSIMAAHHEFEKRIAPILKNLPL